MKRIMVFASDLPAAVGFHRYDSISRPYMKVWKRTSPDTYDEAMKKYESRFNKLYEDEEQLVERVKLESHVKNEIERIQIESKKLDNINELNANNSKIEQVVDQADLGDEMKTLIKQVEISRANKGFGTREEVGAIEKYEKKANVKVVARNDKFYRREVALLTDGDVDIATVLVGGKVDGMTEECGRIVEVKNRMTKIPDEIPLYDVIQFHVYLYCLRKEEGILVERIKTDPNADVSQRIIKWDNNLWYEKVLPGLNKFSSSLSRFIDTPIETKLEFLNHNPKNKLELIRSLVDESARFDYSRSSHKW